MDEHDDATAVASIENGTYRSSERPRLSNSIFGNFAFSYQHPFDYPRSVKRVETPPDGDAGPYPWNLEAKEDVGEDGEAGDDSSEEASSQKTKESDPNADGDIRLDLAADAPPCQVCQWSGRFDQLLHRRNLLDKHCLATLSQLRERASSCQSCSIITKALEKMGHSDDNTTVQFLTSHLEPPGTFFKVVHDTSAPPQIFIHKAEDSTNLNETTDPVISKIGAPTFATLRGDTSLPQSTAWAYHCLRTCWTTHKTCWVSSSGFLPTRLIDVAHQDKEDDQVVLVDTKHLQADEARYIALSHCWGSTPLNCCTTQKNYESRMKGIPWDILPKTFQDAVQFTRKLKFRYLWIDSLCIIQQDAKDWTHESGKMFGVYANSSLTLAAVHAPDSEGGLFASQSNVPDSFFGSLTYRMPYDDKLADVRDRIARITYDIGLSPRGPDVYRLKLQLKKLQDEEWDRICNPRRYRQPLHIRRSLPRFHSWRSQDLPEKSPLFSRAWAYQERLVSPRVLYFTEHELLWECFEGSSCECFEGSSCECTGDSRELGPKQNHQVAVTNSNCRERWRDIVAEYSRLDLTVEQDKLPAISAIAVQIQRTRREADYVAGLWSDSLIRDLLWRTQDASRGRPEEQIAPSWSWVSVKSGVEYPSFNVEFLDALAETVGVDIHYPGVEELESPHAACIIAGTITLRGPLVEFRVLTNGAGPSQWRLKHADSQTTFRFFHDSTTDFSDFDESEPLYGLAIARSKPTATKSFHGLVLRKVQQTGRYSRVGVLLTMSIMVSMKELSMKRMFEECGVHEEVVIE